MKWLVDAQLPYRLAERLQVLGEDAIHTLDLPLGNKTTDSEIISVSETEGRIVVSKDRDFVDSHLLNEQPEKLLWISTGNSRNQELLQLFEQCLTELIASFNQSKFIELTATGLRVH